MPILQMSSISKRFGPTVALRDVSLTVAPGEVHALVGENGAGKSTLMKVLSGALQPDSGTLTLAGEPFAPRGPHDARRASVAMIYQELSLAPHLSAEDNILLGVEPSAFGILGRREIRRRAMAALARFDHPEIRPETLVSHLSPAARQLVEIARAIAVGCRVLVLDEPTSSLTAEDARRLFAIIRSLCDQGLAIVYISHFLEEVKRIADRITVLRDGEVAGAAPAAELSIPDIVTLMVGRSVEDLYPRSRRQRGEPLLQIEDLAGLAEPRSATLTLHRGEVVGIAGLVGAGRTELLRAVFGLDPIRSGALRLGTYCGPASPARCWAAGAGFLSEDRKAEGLALNLTIADNVTASRLQGLGPAGLVLPRQQAAAARRWVDALRIRCTGPTQPVSALSGGNQQKVALARLLHHDVDVLLLDEPTRGIDVGSKAQIYRLIDRLASGQGDDASQPARPRAILMVSSYLPELLGVCDRIAVMYRGHLGPAIPVAELDERAIMLQATGQPAATP